MSSDYRREFFDFEGVAYLATASEGPLPRVSAKAMQAAIEWKKMPHRIPDNAYFELPDRVREKAAKFIGADAEEMAVTTGASAGMGVVAAGMNFQPGDEVVVAKGEFPAHFATWVPYEKAGLVKVKVASPRERFLTAEDYAAAIGPKTRLVSASYVRFDNGARLDAKRVADACHKAGAALLLDLSQAVGVMPIDVRELGADFAVISGYKWLLGPFGTGLFWIAREWQERLALGPAYWMAAEGAENVSMLPGEGMELRPGARRWDTAETAGPIHLMALEASLDFLLQLGVAEAARHTKSIVQEVIERLPRDRYGVVSPLEEENRGPYICLAARRREETAAMYKKLREAGVIVSLRENALRVAPYLYSTSEDVTKLVKILAVA